MKSHHIFTTEISIRGISLSQKGILAKHLAVMLKSGVPISQTLATAEESSTGRLADVIRNIRAAVESGRTLSSAMADHSSAFDGLFLNMVKAGEISGTLVENLEQISKQMGKERQLREKIKSAMVYPSIILAGSIILGVVFAFVILPQVTPLFKGLRIDLPFTTRALIATADIVDRYGGFLLGGMSVGIVALWWLAHRTFLRPAISWMLLHIPISRPIVKSSNLVRFSYTLGMLLQSGIDIDESLHVTSSVMGNYHYQKAMKRMEEAVQGGAKLADNLEKFPHLFPQLLVQMVRVGEDSGKFEETLFFTAEFYEDQLDTATKSLSAAIEPILLLLIGSIVAFLALSIITPIYDITGNIQR
ncbi:MAG: hypothetical protein A2748_00645 [Candidatus Wildermuthbacteria bacterium RIFCSPHIGHO2_01_FULL_45_20]|uniref:Type II secretion system protein GspF domain-containing protein n=1 Tax=Candidatus Wildermuthbacteria bacterium RIFCSPHIGHO2_02_FULL_45_25 TaxID=1802450 RepID=A0A1G2R4N2_9BACT|nr:MAG: hypothetical protein A2748_00645 [Candidatus Wildermuthbacteria bacterium RIFCSPHIGHO2_01_FULL_45_20]OHA67687.1 MAG: hypothetical protein A3C04_02105 [Candidatus Wildermuthbacteria bacterium RIFCSPHIGHO2_02_FULL_45_25]